FGNSATAVLSVGIGERVVLASRVEASVLAHEGGGAPVDAPSVGCAPVLVVVPAEPHVVRLLIDEHEVLHAGGAVAVELDDGHVADDLASRGGCPLRCVVL